MLVNILVFQRGKSEHYFGGWKRTLVIIICVRLPSGISMIAYTLLQSPMVIHCRNEAGCHVLSLRMKHGSLVIVL